MGLDIGRLGVAAKLRNPCYPDGGAQDMDGSDRLKFPRSANPWAAAYFYKSQKISDQSYFMQIIDCRGAGYSFFVVERRRSISRNLSGLQLVMVKSESSSPGYSTNWILLSVEQLTAASLSDLFDHQTRHLFLISPNVHMPLPWRGGTQSATKCLEGQEMGRRGELRELQSVAINTSKSSLPKTISWKHSGKDKWHTYRSMNHQN